tara:strand:+ start:148 stop:873 length:726 start_codon:yes stop_codon:yes gene_type:complete
MNKFIKLYGFHAAIHALANPDRKISKILITENARKKIINKTSINLDKFVHEIVTTKKLNSQLSPGSVHQGIVLICEQKKLNTINNINIKNIQKIILLDNISDPRNIGAILRTCAAYDFTTVISTNRFDQLDEGLIAKSSSGGIEYTNIITSSNLSNILEFLKKNNFWLIGFDSDGLSNINEMNFGVDDKIVLIFGDEGKGIRNLTKNKCHGIYKLDTIGNIKSLNVSVAIGIVLDKITTHN